MKEMLDTIFLTQKGTYIKGQTDVEDGKVKSFYVDLSVHPYYEGIETILPFKDKLIEYKCGRNYPPPSDENE